MPILRLVDSDGRRLARHLETLFYHHRQLSKLCDDLEAIADDLPKVCPRRCARAVAALQKVLGGLHAFEAATLAETLGKQSQLLARILSQHAEDEGLAFEIVLALEPIADGRQPPQPEALGYMLRCFFNNCRRSMLVGELALRSAAA